MWQKKVRKTITTKKKQISLTPSQWCPPLRNVSAGLARYHDLKTYYHEHPNNTIPSYFVFILFHFSLYPSSCFFCGSHTKKFNQSYSTFFHALSSSTCSYLLSHFTLHLLNEMCNNKIDMALISFFSPI